MVAINYTLANTTGGDFLNTTNLTLADPSIPGIYSKSETVMFSQQPNSTEWTANITIPIRATDGMDTYNGKIEVALKDPTSNRTYQVISNTSKGDHNHRN